MAAEMTLHINLDFYHGRLVAELDSNLVALRTTLRSIEDGSYASAPLSNSGVLKMTLSMPDPAVLRKQEIEKCFKAVVGSLQDFMDRLIGILNMSRGKIIIDRSISTDAEFKQFFADIETRFIQEVARDKSLKVPHKLDILKVHDPVIRTMVDGYFAARNSIEHHKGLADRDIDLNYRIFTLLAGDKEITALPFQVTENTPIMLGARDGGRKILAHTQIEISEDEMENVTQTIRNFIALGMAQDVSAMMTDERTVSS